MPSLHEVTVCTEPTLSSVSEGEFLYKPRQEAGGRRQKAGDRRQKVGGRRQEVGGRRQEAEGIGKEEVSF